MKYRSAKKLLTFSDLNLQNRRINTIVRATVETFSTFIRVSSFTSQTCVKQASVDSKNMELLR